MKELYFPLTEEEAKALYDYFLKRAGYVSAEFDPLILLLIRKLHNFLEGG